jgi:hypothetical protein
LLGCPKFPRKVIGVYFMLRRGDIFSLERCLATRAA